MQERHLKFIDDMRKKGLVTNCLPPWLSFAWLFGFDLKPPMYWRFITLFAFYFLWWGLLLSAIVMTLVIIMDVEVNPTRVKIGIAIVSAFGALGVALFNATLRRKSISHWEMYR